MILQGISGLGRKRPDEPAGARLPGSAAKKAVIGSAAGVLPGLLGIGTGGILVPAFTLGLKAPIKTAMAASLACFCFNALISASFKAAQGYIDFAVAVPVCIGTLLGASAGAVLNKRFHARVVTLLFGFLFAYVAVKFILSSMGISA